MYWRVIVLISILALGNPLSLADDIITIKKPKLRSIHFVDSLHGWAGGYRGLFHTIDGGRTWQQQKAIVGSETEFTTTAAIRDTGWICWADKNTAVIRSDKGLIIGAANFEEWRQIKIRKEILEDLNAVDFVDQQNGWGVGSGGRVYQTKDGGMSWQLINTNEKKLLKGLFAVSANEVWIVGQDTTILHSIDGGQSWEQQVFNPNTLEYGLKTDLLSITFANPRSGWICGTDGTILSTDDGGKRWQRQISPYISNMSLSSLSFSDENTGWVVGQRYIKGGMYENLLLFTRNGGKKWEPIIIETKERLIDIRALPDGKVFVITEEGSMFRSIDQGENWLAIHIE